MASAKTKISSPIASRISSLQELWDVNLEL